MKKDAHDYSRSKGYLDSGGHSDSTWLILVEARVKEFLHSASQAVFVSFKMKVLISETVVLGV